MNPLPEDAQHPAGETDGWRRTISIRMDAFDRQLADNTKATEEVKKNTAEMLAVFDSWKGAMKALEMIGRIAKPLAYITSFLGGLVAAWVAWPKK